MPTIRANGIDLHVERRGTGHRLLFLNGSGATLATSGMIVDLFAARFDVAAHDQRGLGLTGVPPGPYSMADYAADALALMDHLGWGSCRVVGISFGGMVAQEVAATAPERVERLALVCTSPGGVNASYPLHELAGMSDAVERAAIWQRILDTRFTDEWLATHDVDALIAGMVADRALAPRTEEQRLGERLQLEARAAHDVNDRLGRITAPTLVAAGRFDGIAPLANAEAIVARIASAELRVYEGGHAFLGQDPAALPDLLEFLAAGRRGGGTGLAMPAN